MHKVGLIHRIEHACSTAIHDIEHAPGVVAHGIARAGRSLASRIHSKRSKNDQKSSNISIHKELYYIPYSQLSALQAKLKAPIWEGKEGVTKIFKGNNGESVGVLTWEKFFNASQLELELTNIDLQVLGTLMDTHSDGFIDIETLINFMNCSPEQLHKISRTDTDSLEYKIERAEDSLKYQEIISREAKSQVSILRILAKKHKGYPDFDTFLELLKTLLHEQKKPSPRLNRRLYNIFKIASDGSISWDEFAEKKKHALRKFYESPHHNNENYFSKLSNAILRCSELSKHMKYLRHLAEAKEDKACVDDVVEAEEIQFAIEDQLNRSHNPASVAFYKGKSWSRKELIDLTRKNTELRKAKYLKSANVEPAQGLEAIELIQSVYSKASIEARKYRLGLQQRMTSCQLSQQAILKIQLKLRSKSLSTNGFDVSSKFHWTGDDISNSGVLDWEEFSHTLRTLVDLSKTEILCVKEILDGNKDGQIDRSEFEHFVMFAPQRLEAVFIRHFDKVLSRRLKDLGTSHTTLSNLHKKLRDHAYSRGGIGITKQFHWMGIDGSRHLDWAVFEKGIKRSLKQSMKRSIQLNAEEIRLLKCIFYFPETGKMKPDEFMHFIETDNINKFAKKKE